jgi:hypothetical protein
MALSIVDGLLNLLDLIVYWVGKLTGRKANERDDPEPPGDAPVT